MLTSKRKKEYYRALLEKNTKFDGIFFVGDKTTSMFCRPSCSRTKPTIENCEFFETAQQARLASYKPCNECRPDIDLPGRLPPGRAEKSGSYLADETESMMRSQREAEQQGHRRLAKVHAREHNEATKQEAPEGELQNSILQHPDLDNQRYDGHDPNVNPEPPLNTEARREFDNERREQEMEKQLRLGNMPKFSTAPKPQGP